MGHVIRDKRKLLNRMRRIRGKVEAIERALDGEVGCGSFIRSPGAVARSTAC
jgi:DNA-binding FrmR family transcriptional regulator